MCFGGQVGPCPVRGIWKASWEAAQGHSLRYGGKGVLAGGGRGTRTLECPPPGYPFCSIGLFDSCCFQHIFSLHLDSKLLACGYCRSGCGDRSRIRAVPRRIHASVSLPVKCLLTLCFKVFSCNQHKTSKENVHSLTMWIGPPISRATSFISTMTKSQGKELGGPASPQLVASEVSSLASSGTASRLVRRDIQRKVRRGPRCPPPGGLGSREQQKGTWSQNIPTKVTPS